MHSSVFRLSAWTIVLCAMVSMSASRSFAQDLIVDQGQPRADIVIADVPTRAAKLAAVELRCFINQISGGMPEIVAEPGKDMPVHIYVGASKHTDRLILTADDLKYGAFRMVSGDGWLALLCSDEEFGDATRLGRDIERLKGLSAQIVEKIENLQKHGPKCSVSAL